MTDPSPQQPAEAPEPGEVPEEYRMSRGERPNRIRRRNLITGIILLALIGTIIGVTIYSRATSEEASYGVEKEARPPFGSDHGAQKKAPREKSRPDKQ